MPKEKGGKRRPVKIEDLTKYVFVSDPQISPEGKIIAFVLSKIDKKKDTYIQEIWITPVKGGAPRRYTHGLKDSYPRWSPDGKWLLFLSGRGDEKEGQQIFLLPREGGEAIQLTKVKGGASDPTWSPNSKRIFFLASPEEKEKGKKKPDVKVIDRILYKINGMGFVYNKRWHLFSVSIKGGKPKQLTQGNFDINSFACSPDNKWIAFISNLEEDCDRAVERNIYRIPVRGGKPKKIIETKGPIEQIAFSPDGKWLTYFGHDMHKKFATDQGVWIVPSKGGKPKNLTKGSGISSWVYVNSDSRMATPSPPPIFSPDIKKIYFLGGRGGAAHILSVSLNGKIEPVLGGKRTIEGFSFSNDFSHLAFSYMDATHPAELFVTTKGNLSKEKRLTRFNTRLLNRLDLTEPESFKFKSFDGIEIEGWIIWPPRDQRKDKIPAVLEIHGGPITAYGYAYEHEFHVLASKGYAVIFVNPRGSSGYGEDFAYKVVERWGDEDSKDLLLAVEHVLSKHKNIDGTRLGVTGGSYGGFMTNWLVGHTKRFKAAVTQRSVVNLFSFLGSSDFGYMFNYEFGGYPWESEEIEKKYREHSPIWYAKNIETPLLIIHSENDFRCPISQAEELYAALKILKKPVKFVRFPGENHDLSRSGKPTHRIERLRHIVGWFDEYLKKDKEE